MLKPVFSVALGCPRAVFNYFWGGSRAVQERSKRRPRGKRPPPRAEEAPRWVQDTSGTPGRSGTSKFMTFRDPKVAIFDGLEHSGRHPRAVQDIIRQTCCVKSFPRYSETSRPGPPSEKASRDASRSASLDVPGQASEGWAAVPRRRRLGY